ncbi:MAG: DHHA1 domain-containing protein, partial [Eubacteriales bacterium]
MIYTLLKKMHNTFSVDVATNLYAAIVTDTGRFSYSSTTERTHMIAAELLKSGIKLAYIHNKLYEEKPLAYINLLYRALGNLELYNDGKIAVISVSKEDFTKSGAESNLSEGLINHARCIENVETAASLKEVKPLEVKVSLRSNLWLDVNKVANKFGGGGHVRASGCILHMTLSEAKEKIVAALEEALKYERDN